MAREITDDEQRTWSCVQAFAGLGDSAAADAAAAKLTSTEGTVAVVCTPSGGAQSVRLELPTDWEAAVDDAALASAIAAART